MSIENENWLIETGDAVIAKRAASGSSSLSDAERATYCLWVIDYSVRNSGTLNEIEGLYPAALAELNQFARENQCSRLLQISSTENQTSDERFLEEYYRLFDPACAEIRKLYERA